MSKQILASFATALAICAPSTAQAETVEQRLSSIPCDEILYAPGTEASSVTGSPAVFHGRGNVGTNAKVVCSVQKQPDSDLASISIAELVMFGETPARIDHFTNSITIKVQTGATPEGQAIWSVPFIECAVIDTGHYCSGFIGLNEMIYLVAGWQGQNLINLFIGTKIMQGDEPTNTFRDADPQKVMQLAMVGQNLTLYAAQGEEREPGVAARFESDPEETLAFLGALFESTTDSTVELQFTSGTGEQAELKAITIVSAQIQELFEIMMQVTDQLPKQEVTG